MSYAAKKLLDRYWDCRLPVDPFKLAKAWGARVEALEESAYNNDGLSGLAVIKKGVHRIYFDSSEHSNRQRFTVAHELGHHVLGIPRTESTIGIMSGIIQQVLVITVRLKQTSLLLSC
ncbi:ImmA/IrrE family metallo-endopeptidase [Salmonella enterica subsp. enterica serovar Infantis]